MDDSLKSTLLAEAAALMKTPSASATLTETVGLTEVPSVENIAELAASMAGNPFGGSSIDALSLLFPEETLPDRSVLEEGFAVFLELAEGVFCIGANYGLNEEDVAVYSQSYAFWSLVDRIAFDTFKVSMGPISELMDKQELTNEEFLTAAATVPFPDFDMIQFGRIAELSKSIIVRDFVSKTIDLITTV